MSNMTDRDRYIIKSEMTRVVATLLVVAEHEDMRELLRELIREIKDSPVYDTALPQWRHRAVLDAIEAEFLRIEGDG